MAACLWMPPVAPLYDKRTLNRGKAPRLVLLGWSRLKVFKPSRVKVNTGRTVRILKGISTISLIAVAALTAQGAAA
jgi:hypothetical protein